MLLARAGLRLTRQPLMWGLPGAGAVLTPAEAGLFAQMPIAQDLTGLHRIGPNRIGLRADVLSRRQAQHLFGPGAGALPQVWKMRCRGLHRRPSQRRSWRQQVCVVPCLPIRHLWVARDWQESWRQF